VAPVIRRILEERIAVGEQLPGSWLPSIRELAAEMGINRNTVSKVYESMSRDGYIEPVPGRGFRVISNRPGGAGATETADALKTLVRRANAVGLTREWVVDTVRHAASEVYDERPLRIGFIECNEEGAGVLSENLAKHLGHSVEPVLLDDLAAGTDRELGRFDIVMTTLFHLQEVNALVDRTETEVVGINHEVSYESILEIARLKPGIRIVVVCPNQRTLERVEGIVRMYARGEIVTCTIEDRATAAAALVSADVAITTSGTHGFVEELMPKLARVIVRFHIEEQSIEYVRLVVRRHAREGAAGISAAAG
jgi:DNA-binding transcriptional regulator YhcF (GntR family)